MATVGIRQEERQVPVSGKVGVRKRTNKHLKWHYDANHAAQRGVPHSTTRSTYDHKAHEKMHLFFMKDEDKKSSLRKDAHEQVKHGATKGRVAAHALLATLEEFVSRVKQAKTGEERDKVLSEMHDWLSYVHAQHDAHDLHNEHEFRDAYLEAHTTHAQMTAAHASRQ